MRSSASSRRCGRPAGGLQGAGSPQTEDGDDGGTTMDRGSSVQHQETLPRATDSASGASDITASVCVQSALLISP